MSKSPEDILTNTARPATDATLTVRIIKSLRFRTEKSLVLHNIDFTSTTVAQLKSAATQGKSTSRIRSSAHNLQPSHSSPAGSHIAHASLVSLHFAGPAPHLSSSRHPQALHEGSRGQGQSATLPRNLLSDYFQTSNLIINLDHEEWILDNDDKTLAEVGLGTSFLSPASHSNNSVENESEVSFFNRKDYEDFKLNPEVLTRCSIRQLNIHNIRLRLAGMYEFEVLDVYQCRKRESTSAARVTMNIRSVYNISKEKRALAHIYWFAHCTRGSS